ncbi:MAG: hypothetical protein AMXMBFR53_44080 [Gemmatimonadota bacterium]
MIVLVAALASPFLLKGGGTDPQPVRETPFRLSHPAVAGGSPEVVLYVSQHCRWCAIEMAGWGALAASGEARVPLLALSPDSDPDQVVPALPQGFRRRWVHDRDGSLGLALGVRGVPFRAHIDSGGSVVEVAIGLTTVARRREILRILNPVPPLTEEHP